MNSVIFFSKCKIKAFFSTWCYLLIICGFYTKENYPKLFDPYLAIKETCLSKPNTLY